MHSERSFLPRGFALAYRPVGLHAEMTAEISASPQLELVQASTEISLVWRNSMNRLARGTLGTASGVLRPETAHQLSEGLIAASLWAVSDCWC